MNNSSTNAMRSRHVAAHQMQRLPLGKLFSSDRSLAFAYLASLIFITVSLNSAYCQNTFCSRLNASSNQYLQAQDSPSLDIGTDITLEAWVKPVSSGNRTIVSKVNTQGGWSYTLGVYADGTIRVDLYQNDTTFRYAMTNSGTLSINTWQHIAATYIHSTNTVHIFVNGVDMPFQNGGGVITGIQNTATPVVIGANGSGASKERFFDGRIDDVRIWSIARSKEQIIAAMFQELSGSEPGLRAYWKLNNTLNDSSANNNTLTNQNLTTFESNDLPFYGQGNIKTKTIRLENISAVDSYVNSGAPSTAFGTKPEARTGGSEYENRLLLKFPTSGFPATITKATLYLFCKGNNQAAAGNAPQSLYTPNTTWTNTVAWSTKPLATLVSSIVSTPAVGQWVPIEITSQLSGWLSGGANNGIELRSNGGANQENVFASLESSIASERPYLVIEYSPTSNLIWSEEFNGNSLDSNTWSIVRGGGAANGGIATVSGGWSGEVSSIGKKLFQIEDRPVTFEFRMKSDGGDAAFTVYDAAGTGIDYVSLVETSWPDFRGLRLSTNGVFGSNNQSNSVSTTAWKEYRLVVNGNQITGSRGDSLNSLNETLSRTMTVSAAGRSFYIGLTNGQNIQSYFDWIRVSGPPISVAGTVTMPGAASGKVILFSGACTTVAPALGAYLLEVFPGPQQVWAYLDTNDNGKREPWEPFGKYSDPALNVSSSLTGINITLTLPEDTDNDGMSDEWELANGLNPVGNDSQGDLDSDGLPNIAEYRLQTQVGHSDSDGDGRMDGPEIASGTNAVAVDTDSDGMDDAWEIFNGLNPLINDASLDLDLDGLTNKEEYDLRATGYRANAWNSKAGTVGDDFLSDYRRLKGEGWVRRGYDKNDRLISTEKDTGSAQLYRYDGNSNKTKDIVLTSLDMDGDGLPDSWEFANNLSYAGTGASSGTNGASGDPDLDGFTNMQEWQAGTDPRDATSRPNTGAVQVANTIAAASGFVPSNWVMATGQLDGLGADEVVVGADGAIGTSSNQFSVYRNTGNSWAVTPTNVGSFGINSLAIGEVAAGRGASIFFGARPASGLAGIQEFRLTGNSWLKSAPSVADSAGTGVAQVIGANSSGVIGLLSPVSQAVDGIYRTTPVSDTWPAPAVLSSSAGKRSWPTPVSSGAARWLDAGGIEINAGSPSVVLGAIKNPANGNWYFLSPSAVTWPNAELFATQSGGHLATVNDNAEQQWIQTNFPAQNIWIGLLRGSTGDGWQWISGETATYRNWAGGEPNNAGGSEPYGHITSGSTWNDSSAVATLRGLVEIPSSSVPLQTLPDPIATSKLIWRGHSLATGQLRTGTSSGTSVVYAFIDDKDISGTANSGDTFVVGEYELTTPSPVQRTTVTLPITSSISSSAIGVTILKRQNPSLPSALAIGEPDGTVSLWTAPEVGSPLVRKIFTTEFIGKSWHQLEVFREANGAEGLVGLLVDPTTPAQCQLIHWSPDSIEAALNGTAPVLNNVPSARILSTPSQGGTTGSVAVRIWDAEAHGSSLELQYQRNGETTWSNATLNTADGTTFQPTLKLSSQPAGISHTLVWNAAANLGSTFSGTVLLRTRATDTQTGEWSPGMPYAVNTSINLDADNDGIPDAWESVNGLSSSNPSDGNSDYDRDGVTAFLEYALVMNATMPDVALLPILGTTTEADGKHLTLTYRRPINSGLTYTAERSLTLGAESWQSGNGVFQELTPVNLGDGTESVTVEDLNPISSSMRAWLRLRVNK